MVNFVGPGGITRAILENDPQRLDVVEIDRQFLRPLQVSFMTSYNLNLPTF
jgi:16S rRNA A1518/A1519 N6-dimethyltransferase RsmA/KsgA/DIM1 with predicted DNA glycosylase/AP lyase activity